jgi:hypothetical protein
MRFIVGIMWGAETHRSNIMIKLNLHSTVEGGLKFHCWRTISRNELPPSEDHRKTNSCVRITSFSSKTSDICFSFWGWSKTSRIVSVPDIAARQPGVSPETSADSIGKSLSSDETSTTAARSRSSQPSPPDGTVPGVRVMPQFTSGPTRGDYRLKTHALLSRF